MKSMNKKHTDTLKIDVTAYKSYSSSIPVT